MLCCDLFEMMFEKCDSRDTLPRPAMYWNFFFWNIGWANGHYAQSLDELTAQQTSCAPRQSKISQRVLLILR